jgi:hypothetical protein
MAVVVAEKTERTGGAGCGFFFRAHAQPLLLYDTTIRLLSQLYRYFILLGDYSVCCSRLEKMVRGYENHC